MDDLIETYGLDRFVLGNDNVFPSQLDDLPVAFYATNRDGDIIYYNRHAIMLWGRIPVKGRDKWCADYDLYTVCGRFIPREESAMALAAKQGKKLRGVEAIAVRQNNSAFRFLPFPTPLYNQNGELVGAFNMVIYLGEVEMRLPEAEIAFQTHSYDANHEAGGSSNQAG